MSDKKEKEFLCKRLKELREKNNCTMEDMAKKLHKANKSSISRVESGNTSKKTLLDLAKEYCEAFGMSEMQTAQFLRGNKIAVPDTSALLRNPQLIDELNNEYSKVIIPKIVIDELDNIKNKNSGAFGRKAWEVLRGVSYGDRTVLMTYNGEDTTINEDCKIISIAEEASIKYNSVVDILTEDTDYSAYLKGHETVKAMHLKEYMLTKQSLINMAKINKINHYFSDKYTEIETPTREEANAYLANGDTLIISTIKNKFATFNEKKEKIRWLISRGADVDKRECNRRYFPPLSISIQSKDYELFLFLLNECKANPNIGSRNPHDAGKVRQKNEGNMPLMIAAWHGNDKVVEALCKDNRTSINQQDANGFTALIKACANGHTRCRDILLKYNADTKIIDIDGKTADDHYNEHFEFGPMNKRGTNKSKEKR